MSDLIPPAPTSPVSYRPIEVFIARQRRPRYWLHLALLLATVFTTLVVGSRLEFNFQHNQAMYPLTDDAIVPFFHLHWILEQPSRLELGIPFSATLMLILFAHEMGHYLFCVRYGVHATLPFFIPAPTLIGTLGAVIRVHPPFRSRNDLFDIAIAGPIAGFVVAIAGLFWGLALSRPMQPSVPPSAVMFGFPPICRLALGLLSVFSSLPVAHYSISRIYLHPIGVAAVIGMFATAINLIPGGQLDGGHIAYAVSPRLHRYLSRTSVFVLLLLGLPGTGLNGWMGWLIWALMLLVLGTRHPWVPESPELSSGRRLLAFAALVLLLLTFTPAPFFGSAVAMPR